MKVAKNMDSVFASCTQDELDFDAFFDKDDCLIDMVAGVDEAGNLITGDYVDIDKIIEAAENEMVGEKPDFDYQKDGDAAYSLKDAEGTKNVNPKIGGEVGNQPSLAKQDSAESNADDTKDEEEAIGANDKQQTSLEAYVAAFDESYADVYNNYLINCEGVDVFRESMKQNVQMAKAVGAIDKQGHLKVKKAADQAASVAKKTADQATSTVEKTVSEIKASATSTAEKTITKAVESGKSESQAKEEAKKSIKSMIENLPDNKKKLIAGGTIAAIVTAAVGAGFAIYLKKKKNKKKDEEEKSTNEAVVDTIGASIDGDSSKDILKDDDDADLRNGSVKEDDKNIEGVSTKAVAGEGSCPNCGKSHNDCSCSCNESAIDRLANSILESIFDSADLDILVSESDDPIEDNCDTGERAGAIKHDTSEVEGKDAEPIGAAVKGIDHSDILKDDDDADLRDGSAKEDDKNIEGVSSKVIEAAGNDSAEDKAAIDAEKQDEPNEQDDQNVETESIDIELEEEYDITLEADDCEDCDKNATQATNEEDAPADNGGASEPANEEDAPTDGGDSSDSTNESIDIELEEEYDINIDKEFSDDIAAVDGADETIPDNVQVSDSSNDIKPDRDRDSFKESGLFGDMLSMLESSEEDAVADDEDDALIDMIKNDKADVEDVELDYSYDDDELIDMVASGAVDKIDEE